MSEEVRAKDSGEQRTLLAFALCMAVFWIWSNFFGPKPEPTDAADPGAAPVATADAPVAAPAAPVVPVVPVDRPCADARQTFATSTFQLSVSDCGVVRAIDLPGVQAPVTVTPWWTWVYEKGAAIVAGGADPGAWVPYRSGGDHETLLGPNGALLGVGRGDLGLPSRTLAEVKSADGTVSWARQEGGLTVTQTLAPGSAPDLATVTVRWEADRPLVGPFWVSGEDEFAPIKSTYDMHPRLEASAPSLDTLTSPQDLKAPKDVGTEPASWFGIGDRYFLAALMPTGETRGTVKYAPLPAGQDAARSHVGVYFLSDVTDIAPGKPLEQTFQLYVGPKKSERLSAIGSGLETGVSLGWFAFFAKIVLFTLHLFNGVIPSWGLCIIALTFLIRASLFPLAAKGFRSGKAMQAVQPLIKELQTLYPDDKEKQSAETMRIMREHGVNPLAGCLPIIPQMLVFWALAAALNASPDLYGAHFLYLQDLSMQDPYGVLAVLIIAGMYGQQLLMPMTGIDPSQAQMMKAMPLIFGFLMFSYPSGMSVYYVVNTTLMIAQQWYITRHGGTVSASPLPI